LSVDFGGTRGKSARTIERRGKTVTGEILKYG